MNTIIFRIPVCVAAVFCFPGTALHGATFIPTVDAIIYDGYPGAPKDGDPERVTDGGGGLDVFNVAGFESRSAIEFAPGRLTGPVTSALLVLPVASANGPFPIRLDLYAYGGDGAISLADFVAGTFVATVSYSNQTHLVFDVTGVVSEFSAIGASHIGFGLRAPDESPVRLNGPVVTFSSLELGGLLSRPTPPATLRINDVDGDGVEDRIDQCPDTPEGTAVSDLGCSIDQLVPCAGPIAGGTWRSHGQYVLAVLRTATAFHSAGLITRSEKKAIVLAALRADCGRRHRSW